MMKLPKFRGPDTHCKCQGQKWYLLSCFHVLADPVCISSESYQTLEALLSLMLHDNWLRESLLALYDVPCACVVCCAGNNALEQAQIFSSPTQFGVAEVMFKQVCDTEHME